MLLCLHLKYPIFDSVHSYYISLYQTPFWNMSLAWEQTSGLPQDWQNRGGNRNAVPTFRPEYKVSTLYSGTRHSARILAWVLEKGCVHSNDPTRTVLGHRARASNVNAAYENRKVSSTWRVIRLAAGYYFWDGRFTLLAGRPFTHLNTLARPTGSTRSR